MTITQIHRSRLDLDHKILKGQGHFLWDRYKITSQTFKNNLPIVEMDARTKTLLIPISSILKKDSNSCATGFWMITTANNKWLVSKMFAVMVSHDFYLVINGHLGSLQSDRVMRWPFKMLMTIFLSVNLFKNIPSNFWIIFGIGSSCDWHHHCNQCCHW